MHHAGRPFETGALQQLCTAGLVAVLFATGFVTAQDTPDGVPPDAKRRVLDLKYSVQNIGGKVEDLRLKETPSEYRIELAADVLFDFDKANIKPVAAAVLKKAADFVGSHAVGTIRIEGHTDAKGTDAYNQKLSEQRAKAVKDWLATQGGLTSMAFATKGLGAKQPVAPNIKSDGTDDPDGREKNRRVEIILAKKT
jgi:outer membrane protein OmpA-like peptidoglycan-associated protein